MPKKRIEEKSKEKRGHLFKFWEVDCVDNKNRGYHKKCAKVEKNVDEWPEMLKMCISLSTVETAQIKDFFETK